MKILFFSALGIILFLAEFLALRYSIRNLLRIPGRSLLWCLVFLGGIGGLYIPRRFAELTYQLNPKWQVLGFPFPSVFFEDKGDMLWDYVGELSLVSHYANFIVLFLVPQILVAVVHKLLNKRAAEQVTAADSARGSSGAPLAKS